MADEQSKALVVNPLPKIEEPANLKTVVTEKQHVNVNTKQPEEKFKYDPAHPLTHGTVPDSHPLKLKKEVKSEGKA